MNIKKVINRLCELSAISVNSVVKLLFILIILTSISCQNHHKTDLADLFTNPPENAKPWVFWYWIKAAVSKEGITADLEAMSRNGIGGAYLIPVQGAEKPPLYEPVAEQLTPEWWNMIEFAFQEAKRLGLKIAMHSCDGFAVAGGPWITPEMSMQKIVWSELSLNGDQHFADTLPQPETIRNYYKDIAIYAYPAPTDTKYSTDNIKPVITSNLTSENIQFLSDPENNRVFKSKKEGWIQYAFDKPFKCRTIHIRTKGQNYASNRLIIEVSDDGIHFKRITRLQPPRHGWQDYEENHTYSIPVTTAKYFRFIYSRNGFEPGSEDLDAARWNPALKLQGINLSGKPVIDRFEGKNGSIWRISVRSDTSVLTDNDCISLNEIIDITEKVDSNGILNWDVPKGQWTILRIGHTSTGHTNYIGGTGLGLECDKFDPKIVEFQFNQWFGKVFEKIDKELANEVLKLFHIDSWECGSQNWSVVFRKEFKKRRGYDIRQYLPVMTGLPLESANLSEKVLYDVRKTINELITDNFFGTMSKLAKSKGCVFSSESIAPVMVSDAMAHYKNTDIPMGEFWFNSPTHDKPTDVLDAISAGHIYGKNIIQSEAFTTLRMDWNENPALLKSLGDRNFALGVNRFVFHVFAHNPWIDRQPGMTLNTVGLYFQRDQTWWKQGKAWIDYIQRCQALLQKGKPVVDVAVFTGEDYPRRALTPDRLVDILPGLFGEKVVEREKIRLANTGVPQLERPYSVTSSANTFDPANWVNPLRGYKYDSFNKDALIRLASVKDGKIVLPDGQSYSILVIPGKRKGSPNGLMSGETANKIIQLVKDGAKIIIDNNEAVTPGLIAGSKNEVFELLNQVLSDTIANSIILGKGKIIRAPYHESTFNSLGIERDLEMTAATDLTNQIAWSHRKGEDFDLYFISNQKDTTITFEVSMRVDQKLPEIYNPNTGEIRAAKTYSIKDGRTSLPLKLDAYQSLFIVLQKKSGLSGINNGNSWRKFEIQKTITTPWQVKFDAEKGGPKNPIKMTALTDWSKSENDSIKYYSGTAVYKNSFKLNEAENEKLWLDLEHIYDIAEVFINGQSCGIIWTPPYRLDITNALVQGGNSIDIYVTNTWKNRIIGDNTIFSSEPLTWTTAPFRIKGQPLAESGLTGIVCILKEKKQASTMRLSKKSK